MYSGSVALTGTQSAGVAPATSVSQSTSRSPSVARAASRWSMTTLFGWCFVLARASSMIGLYSTTLAGSMPQDAATITFGVASSMRLASSFGANPPNTTECTAPSRAHASIATTARGTMGM